jgi:enamine deaminase RidA (YjgF/YER057c/UK114 family)
MRIYQALGAILAIGGVLIAAQPQQKLVTQFLNPIGVQRANVWYTDVVTARPGKIIYISGQGGQATDGKLPADFPSQAKNTFENLKKCLAAAGATFKDVVKMNTYLTDVSYQEEFRRTRTLYLNPKAPPASTIIIAGLGEKGHLVEVEVVAVVPD